MTFFKRDGARVRRLNSIVCSPLFLFSGLHAQTSCPLDATGNTSDAETIVQAEALGKKGKQNTTQQAQACLPNQKSTSRHISAWFTWLKCLCTSNIEFGCLQQWIPRCTVHHRCSLKPRELFLTRGRNLNSSRSS